MKIETYSYPHSSFLAVEKDMGLLVELIMKNERLQKLVYYDIPTALDQPRVPQDKVLEMFGQQIKIVPKLKGDKPEFCYIVISFDNFTENATNPAFRDNIISFDIVCHYNQWNLKNFELRPYRIAAELDSMLNDKHLTGIGQIQFLGCSQIVLSDEFAGLTLMYQTIHGYRGEDSKNPLVPQQQQDINQNFDRIFNNNGIRYSDGSNVWN